MNEKFPQGSELLGLSEKDTISFKEYPESQENLNAISISIESLFEKYGVAIEVSLSADDFLVVLDTDNSRDKFGDILALHDSPSGKAVISEAFFNQHGDDMLQAIKQQFGDQAAEHVGLYKPHFITHESVHSITHEEAHSYQEAKLSNYDEAITEWIARKVSFDLGNAVYPGYQHQVEALEAIAEKFAPLDNLEEINPFIQAVLKDVVNGRGSALEMIENMYGSRAIKAFESFSNTFDKKNEENRKHNARVVEFFRSNDHVERGTIAEEIFLYT